MSEVLWLSSNGQSMQAPAGGEECQAQSLAGNRGCPQVEKRVSMGRADHVSHCLTQVVAGSFLSHLGQARQRTPFLTEPATTGF